MAAYCHRIRQDSVTIEPEADRHGHFRHGNPLARHRLDAENPGPRGRDRMEALVLMSLAGHAAQKRFNPRSVRSWHGLEDAKSAIDLVGYFVGSNAEHDAYVNLLLIRANAFVARSDIWAAIDALAQHLIVQRRMGRTELRSTIRTALANSPLDPTGPIRTKAD